MDALTKILDQIERGDAEASSRLLPIVYDELRKLASARLAQEQRAGRHDATSLVHEAYLRLVGDDSTRSWQNRAHFFSAAAEAMRRILVDDARRKRRPKHGGDRRQIELNSHSLATDATSDDLLALDEALSRFAQVDPEKSALVTLRYFGGLSLEECAAAQGVSLATVKRRWAFARAWLFDALSEGT